MSTTEFPRLQRALQEGGEVFANRTALSVDVSLLLPKTDGVQAARIGGATYLLSHCLSEFEKHLGGTPPPRSAYHSIDTLPIRQGTDLRLTAGNNGMLNLEVIGWSGDLRAQFTAATVELLLSEADRTLK